MTHNEIQLWMHDLCRITMIRFYVVLGYVFLFLQGFSKAFLFTSLHNFFFLLFFYCDELHCHVWQQCHDSFLWCWGVIRKLISCVMNGPQNPSTHPSPKRWNFHRLCLKGKYIYPQGRIPHLIDIPKIGSFVILFR